MSLSGFGAPIEAKEATTGSVLAVMTSDADTLYHLRQGGSKCSGFRISLKCSPSTICNRLNVFERLIGSPCLLPLQMIII
jgi:hypothetical protein